MIEALGPQLPQWLERAIGVLRLMLIVFALLVVLVVMLPFHLLALATGSDWAARIPVTFHRILLWLLGIRVRIEGTVTRDRPLLLVSNHVSLLDIPVLSTIAPLSFIAKSEIREWPVIGLFARMQQTVFIERGERRKAGQQARVIAARLAARGIMVLFPEGTTGDANALLPFKTPLFEAAKLALAESDLDHAHVQAVAIQFHSLHGVPLCRAERPHVAWPGEVGLVESLLPVVLRGGLDVTVHCAPATQLTEASNRKVVAAQSRATIRNLLAGGPAPDATLDSAA
ncbi:MAG: lysophospholipid acyltransferase family protein [Pseudomonadota bacterium]